jgi:dihydroflavonol-4-reductase
MRVGLTGGSGFLGSHVLAQLLARGHQVRALVRAPRALGARAAAGLVQVPGDLSDSASLRRLARGTEAIVHAAGLVSLRPRDRQALVRTNVEGTENVLRAAAEAGARFVHASSVAAVGATVAPVVLDEEAPFRLVATDYHYAASKRAADELVLAAGRRGAEVMVLIPGMMFGPGDLRLTSTLPVAEYLQGQMRFHPEGGMSFCDVRDVAAAFVNAVDQGRPGRRYIVAGANWSYRQLFDTLEQLTGLHRTWPAPWPLTYGVGWLSEAIAVMNPHRFEGLNRSVARHARLFNYVDSGRARRELGYRPRDLRTTLRDTIDDLVARGVARGGMQSGQRAGVAVP